MMHPVLSMEPAAFGQFFDHTLLKPHATDADFAAFCDEGIRFNVRMLAVNPAAVAFCKARVADHGIHVGAAIGFPLGQSTLNTKRFETQDAIDAGSDEIDYVINIAQLRNGNLGYIRDEMEAIVSLCRARSVICKVIFENCYLSDPEKIALCQIANDVRPDFIKTSTGFGTGGATLADVRLMRQHTDPDIAIKAASAVRDLDTLIHMVDAGDRKSVV